MRKGDWRAVSSLATFRCLRAGLEVVLTGVGTARGMEDRAGQGSYRRICKGGLCKLWGRGERKPRVLGSGEGGRDKTLSEIKGAAEWEH